MFDRTNEPLLRRLYGDDLSAYQMEALQIFYMYPEAVHLADFPTFLLPIVVTEDDEATVKRPVVRR